MGEWWGRFRENQDWEDLRNRPRTPKRQARKLSSAVRQAIRQVRSELEAEAQDKDELDYVGAFAIRSCLQAREVKPLPSISSIERELHLAGMVKPYQKTVPVDIDYPSLHPTHPLGLIQADILPRFLTGGSAIACFNAIDVVSRYPGGQQYANRTTAVACDFLWSIWQELGLPEYQQLDNEGCFSGGFTHPGVIGKVIRLALWVGVQLVFSPLAHPESNGFVERFHQGYANFVWKKELLPDLPAVRQRSALFYRNYRASRHHSQLAGRSPEECHLAYPTYKIPEGLCLPPKLPLTTGQVHFLRAVDANRQVKVLNLAWDVPNTEPHQGVWITINFSLSGSAALSVFDAAPDAAKRTRLVSHPFQLKDSVLPLSKEFHRQQHTF